MGNKTIVNGALFSLFSFINQGFNFLLLLILANFITPSEYGYLSLFNTCLMVMGYFRVFSTEGYVSVAFFKDSRNGVGKAISSIFILLFITSTISFLVLCVWGDAISSRLSLSKSILMFAVAINFFSLFVSINLDYLRIMERIKAYGIISCLSVFLNFVLSIYLIKYLLTGWEGRVYAQLISYSLIGIFGGLWIIKNVKLQKTDLRYIKTMLIWGIPLIPHMATTFLRQGCDRYIINNSHSIEDVGLFSFALTLVNIITMIGYGFNQSNSVDIYKVLGDKEINNAEKTSKLKSMRRSIILVYLISSVIVTAACYFIIPLLLPKYCGSLKYFVILSLYGFGGCLYLAYTNYLFYFDKTRIIMYITFCSSLLHLLLSFFLTKYSLYYTCFIYIFTQMLIVLLIRYNSKKTLKENLVSNE